MPDEHGNFKGIVVPKLPKSMEKDPEPDEMPHYLKPTNYRGGGLMGRKRKPPQP